MILYMYISPGKELTTPWGQNFDVNRNLLSLQSYVASFKKSPWSLTLYNKCSLAGGRQPPGDKVLMSTDMSCHFIHLLQVLHVFRLEGQIWNPVRRDTKAYVRRILNASRISKNHLTFRTIVRAKKKSYDSVELIFKSWNGLENDKFSK